jgi:hypothetical protein
MNVLQIDWMSKFDDCTIDSYTSYKTVIIAFVLCCSQLSAQFAHRTIWITRLLHIDQGQWLTNSLNKHESFSLIVHVVEKCWN